MKKLFKEFKAFISRGSVIDLAIGVVIGTAFSAIVNSLVNDIIMPLITLATGDGVQGLSLVLNNVDKYILDASGAQIINPEAVLWNYGNFIQTIINFLIIALCLFAGLKCVMSMKAAGEKAKAARIASIDAKLAAGEITAEEAKERKERLGVEEPAAPAPAAPPAPTTEELLTEIRDLLKENGGKSDKTDGETDKK